MAKKDEREKVARLAELADLLGSEARVGILRELAGGEKSVGVLQRVGVSLSGVSQHLAKLKAGGLVKRRRDAQAQFYSLQPGPLEELVDLVQELLAA